MSNIKPVGRKHDDCETCDKHPLFDLDDKVFIHGRDYTKEELLVALEIASDISCTKCDNRCISYSSQGHFLFCPECKAEYHYMQGTWKHENY